MQTPVYERIPGAVAPGASNTAVRPHRNSSLWLAMAASAAIGLAGLGVGVDALQSAPASGPIGARGPAGTQGAVGPQGIQGVVGKEGPAGSPGTIAATTVVSSTALVSAPNPPVGTVLVATTSCPIGEALLGGGAQLSASGASDRNVELRSSFPLTTKTWQTVGLVTASLGSGHSMTMKPYVLCGKP
jgi:hypothetical protein